MIKNLTVDELQEWAESTGAFLLHIKFMKLFSDAC